MWYVVCGRGVSGDDGWGAGAVLHHGAAKHRKCFVRPPDNGIQSYMIDNW